MKKNKNLKPIQAEDFPPLATQEQEEMIKKFYQDNPILQSSSRNLEVSRFLFDVTRSHYNVDLSDEDWIQTYSGRRFTPLNPNPDAIVIQDIAHSLSRQCRYSGHTNEFYSVAQHCVLVSYICDFKDSLYGLLHDATEAYLIDLPRPLKHSGKFDNFVEIERKVSSAICKKFKLEDNEPVSVKRADNIVLATEARDLMCPLRDGWFLAENPLPFKIEPLNSKDAKELFLKRFFELSQMPEAYDLYLMSDIKQ